MDNPIATPSPPHPGLTLLAHITMRGDVAGGLGAWVGEPGSGLHVEGLAVNADTAEAPRLAYQLVFAHDLATPWTPMPYLCGSKGMGLPCRGVRFRLASDALADLDCIYDVTFTDGTRQTAVLGPALALAPPGAFVEAIRLTLPPRQAAAAATPQTVTLQAAPAAGSPPPGGESHWEDETIRLRLLSPSFPSAAPPIRNPDLIPSGSHRAMGKSWNRPGFAERPISLRVVETVYAVHEGLVLDRDLAPIPVTRRGHSEGEIAWAQARVLALRKEGALRRVGGTSLLCKARAVTNYGHYLVEMFPRAWVCEQLFPASLTCLVPQMGLLLVVAESLLRIGIGVDRMVWTDNEPVLCDRLFLLDGLTYHGQYQSPLCLRALDAMAAEVPAAPAARLFIRRGAHNRPLHNEDAVERILRDRGFTVIDPGRMSLAAQIAAFKGAEIVVGALGAALTNIAFCAAGTEVVALTAASFPDTFFWFLSLHAGLRYSEVRGPDHRPDAPKSPWNHGFRMTEADLAYLATL